MNRLMTNKEFVVHSPKVFETTSLDKFNCSPNNTQTEKL